LFQRLRNRALENKGRTERKKAVNVKKVGKPSRHQSSQQIRRIECKTLPDGRVETMPDDESDSDDNSTGKKDQTKRSMQLLESSPEISLIVNELDYT